MFSKVPRNHCVGKYYYSVTVAMARETTVPTSMLR